MDYGPVPCGPLPIVHGPRPRPTDYSTTTYFVGLQPTTYDLRPTTYDLRTTDYSLRPTAYGLWPTAYGLRAYCLHPTWSDYTLRPTSYLVGLQPSAYSLPSRPTAYGLHPTVVRPTGLVVCRGH